MSEPFVEPMSQASMFSVEDFPANPIPSPARAAVPPMNAISGPSLPDSFARLDPDGSWRKTCQGYSQVTLDGSLERFSETWPRAGMTRNGIASQRVPLVLPIYESAYSFWPTPCASDTSNRQPPTRPHITKNGTLRHIGQSGEQSQVRLSQAVKFFPTPTARDYRSGMSREALLRREAQSSRGVNLSEFMQRTQGGNGKLNPPWVEWLMGFPIGWTDCGRSATPSSRKYRKSSGAQ